MSFPKPFLMQAGLFKAVRHLFRRDSAFSYARKGQWIEHNDMIRCMPFDVSLKKQARF